MYKTVLCLKYLLHFNLLRGVLQGLCYLQSKKRLDKVCVLRRAVHHLPSRYALECSSWHTNIDGSSVNRWAIGCNSLPLEHSLEYILFEVTNMSSVFTEKVTLFHPA
jgi:hypothetical protein